METNPLAVPGAQSAPAATFVADAAYVGAIPEHYHRGIGPFLFEPYALHTAERIRAFAPQRVLETACGTGIVTRRLREALAGDASLTATDLNEPMLAVARRTVGAAAHVDFRRADMTALSFPDGAFDAVVCQFGLMFAPDKAAALREARRVLAPGGRLYLTTWGSLERNPVVALAQEVLASLFPDDPPRYLERAPFGYGDPERLAELLLAAGFDPVQVDVVEKAARIDDARELAIGLIEGYPLVDEIRARGEGRVSVAVDTVAHAIVHRFGDAPVRGRIAALVAMGVA